VAVADVRIAAWNNKLLYMMWRPVTAIPLGNGCVCVCVCVMCCV
jgi:hypothetical protein